MGMNMGSGKKGPVSDINVTPLVDVMLVLLVIFMVTAPMLFSGIDLKLPKTQKVNNVGLRPELVILSITEAEQFFIGKNSVASKDLVPAILKQLKESKTEVVYLRADYSLRYEKVAKLIANLKKAGVSNIALVTEVEKSKE
ncbi:biopolymer transporter ExbD [Peredibacter starrii]|uniref:Biopolymer transporter ExbD n=1 Tax=Peredibacter starrii TaxID=28202 RepID=A0AAX4HMF8_9BACT|nr:biopolymer transporter ExbD [Peredibacter starrii]WPU64459.1 biopolymer transporter ExbD [Peredibacter starrii]